MDTLKNKVYLQYNYLNRYSNIPSYYDTLGKKDITGIGKNMLKTATWSSHTVKQSDTLDYLSLKYYNDPTFWWVIAYFNDIPDPFMNLYERFTIIKIPSISNVEFGDIR